MIPIKLLLLEPGDGNGLKTIREKEDKMIDITSFNDGVSDPTITANVGFVVKNNQVYRIIKSYFDLDKNWRVFIAKLDMDSYDIYDPDAGKAESEESKETTGEGSTS